MTIHLYKVAGVDSQGKKFISECYDNDIISAIQQYRANNFSIHQIYQISRKEQVNANTEKKIIYIRRTNEYID